MPGPRLDGAQTTESRFLRIYRKSVSVACGSPNAGFLPYTIINKFQKDSLRLSPKAETIQGKNKRSDCIQI